LFVTAILRVSADELYEKCVKGKLAAMQREAKRFYSGAKGQPWKNIISMGDAQYERLACQELAWLSPPDTDDDKVRIKTFVVPGRTYIAVEDVYMLDASLASLRWGH